MELSSLNHDTSGKKSLMQRIVKMLTKSLAVPHGIKEAKAHDSTEKYWLDPCSPLKEFLRNNGINPPNTVPKFAQGGVGRVYFVGSHAIKITSNRVEANVARMVMGNSDTPTIVIDVDYIGDGFYAILQPTIDMNVPEDIKRAADYVTALGDELCFQFPKSKSRLKKLCSDTISRYGGEKKLLPLMLSIIDMLNKLYNATGYYHDDAGPTNIGLHNGRVVIPDLGPNEPKDFDQLSALSKINKNRESLGLPRHKSF